MARISVESSKAGSCYPLPRPFLILFAAERNPAEHTCKCQYNCVTQFGDAPWMAMIGAPLYGFVRE